MTPAAPARTHYVLEGVEPNSSITADEDEGASVLARVSTIAALLARKRSAELRPESTWRSLGLDSLDLVELMLQCEREFGILISDEQAMALRTVGDMAACVVGLQGSVHSRIT